MNTINELRERIARNVGYYIECGDPDGETTPVEQDHMVADRILATVGELFSLDDVESLRDAAPGSWHDLNALADTLAALRALAQPKEGSNG